MHKLFRFAEHSVAHTIKHDIAKRAGVAPFVFHQLRTAWPCAAGALGSQLVSMLSAIYVTRLIGTAMDAAHLGEESLTDIALRFVAITLLMLFAVGCRWLGDKAVLHHIAQVSSHLITQGYACCQVLVDNRLDALSMSATIHKILRARHSYDVLISTTYFLLIPAGIGIPFAIAITALDSWIGALTMSICLGALIALMFFLSGRPLSVPLKHAAIIESRVGVALSDTLSNQMCVTGWNTQNREMQRLARASERWRTRADAAWRKLVDYTMLQQAMAVITLVAPLSAVAIDIARGHGSIAAATTVVGASFLLRGLLSTIGKAFRDFHTATSQIHEFVSLLDAARQASKSEPLPRFTARDMRITFDNVHFSYPGHTQSVLEGINLTITPGESIGIIGLSGSGKTTFLRLLTGLVLPTEGRVVIDDQDTACIQRDSLRQHIATTPQETGLFARTLWENITYGAGVISRAKVDQVMQSLGLASLIESLPYGYRTMIGERGANLSGGQRQRIAIARALLCERRLLIFDEATANLDAVSEAHSRNAIEKFARGRTCIIVAHRLAAVRNVDRILVFHQGAIVANDSHQALRNSGNIYYLELLNKYYRDIEKWKNTSTTNTSLAQQML